MFQNNGQERKTQVTVPNVVANAFFEDNLEVGVPMVRAKPHATEYSKIASSKN